MPEDAPSPMTPIQPPAPAPSPQELSRWLMQLASWIAKDRLQYPPQGLLVVLINDEHVEVDTIGMATWALYHDAAVAAQDRYQRDYDRARQSIIVADNPQTARESRRARARAQEAAQAANAAAHPYPCAYCGYRRFATTRGQRQHERTCAVEHDGITRDARVAAHQAAEVFTPLRLVDHISQEER